MKKRKRIEKQGLIIKKQFTQQPEQNHSNSFLGFPRVKGSWNNLWRWDTLEDIL